MSNRYKRQIVLPEIGASGQDKISAASVLCIGAGGLGCPALLYLAAAGVGRIGIVDFDIVDESNLQRQVLYSVDQVGVNKATAAKDRLQTLNPDIEIHAYDEELNAENIEDLFHGYDIIIDGSDNFTTKFLINDAAVKLGKPFIYGSILGFKGQVSVFNLEGSACYRCLFPEPPSGHIPNCAEAGVIGAVAGIIGTTQAMEAIKFIVGGDRFETLSGRLWTIDVRSMDTKILGLHKDRHCPICSKNKEEIKLHYTPMPCGIIPEISVQATQQDHSALLLDVREIDEWEAGHIEGAQHFALSEIMQGKSPDLAPDQEVIIYCKAGVRSLQAAQILKERGFTNLHNMTGGIDEWVRQDAA